MGKKKTKRIPHKFLPWIDARKKFQLSHIHIQMARELGMNPRRLGNLVNTKGKPWKAPFSIYIESLYHDRFGRTKPEVVKTIEQMAAEHLEKREAKKRRNQESNSTKQVATQSETDGE